MPLFICSVNGALAVANCPEEICSMKWRAMASGPVEAAGTAAVVSANNATGMSMRAG